MGTTLTAIIIAVLAGVGAFYSWDRNKGLAMGLAVVTLLAGAVGTIGAFIAALGFLLKILPILFVALGVWLIVKIARKDRNPDRNPEPRETPVQ